MKFIHAADLHIDSPLRGLEKLDEAPVDEIRRAPREAFRRLVALAHDEEVDFVVLAGDIFDGNWRDMRTGVFFNTQLQALHPIPVFIVRGNHDAETEILKKLTLPPNAYIFSSHHAQTRLLEDIGVAIHGQSYRTRATFDDLSVGYPKALSGYTNIGVLHTSVGGYQGHEKYAPCTIQSLVSHGYDYWALGHIHTRQLVHDADPLIVFPGNIQGRDIKESGPKGCFLVSGDRDGLTADFHALDSVRWFDERVSVSPASDADDAIALAVEHITGLRADNSDRLLCVRVELSGATNAHRDLILDPARIELELRSRLYPEVWLSHLRIETSPVIDLALLREQDDVPGALFRAIEVLRKDPSNETIRGALKSLNERLPAEVVEMYGTRLDDPELVGEALAGAERLLLAELGRSS